MDDDELDEVDDDDGVDWADLDREQYLADSVRHFERMARRAEGHRSWNAAVAAKRQAVAVRAELDELRQRAVSAAATEKDPIAEVRALRRAATAAGSFVAASRMIELERRLIADLVAEAVDADAEALARLELAEIEAEIAELQSARR